MRELSLSDIFYRTTGRDRAEHSDSAIRRFRLQSFSSQSTRGKLRILLILLVAILTTHANTLENQTTQRLGDALIKDLVVATALVPRFSGMGKGPVCPDNRLPIGAPSPYCDAQSQRLTPSASLKSVIRRRIRGSAHSADPELLRLRALRALLWGSRPKDRDLAVGLLRQAVESRPGSARLHNDLAAALIVRALLDARYSDLLASLHHSQQALALDPSLAEARANTAFGLECFALYEVAASIWHQLENHPQLGSLARSFLNRPAPVPGSLPDEAEQLRREGQKALSLWAMGEESSDPTAGDRHLGLAARHGERLAATGDSTLRDAAREIRVARQSNEQARYELLRSAHASLAQAQKPPKDPCDPSLEQAARKFELAGSPLHAWTTFELAICAYYGRDLSSAESLLDEIAESFSSEQSTRLDGRLHWLSGLVAMRQGYFSSAAGHYQSAVSIYEDLSESGLVAYLNLLEATNFELLGDREKAWAKRLPALHRRHLIRDPIRAHTVVEETARAVSRQSDPALAIFFLYAQVRAGQQVLEVAEDPNDGLDLLAYALLDRAKIHAASGDRDEAGRNIAQASDLVGRLPEQHPNRERLGHEVKAARALYLDYDPDALDEALRFFGASDRSSSDLANLLDLYAARARLHQRNGDSKAAEADLTEAIGRVESTRWEVLDAPQRARHLAKLRQLVESLVSIQLTTGRHLQALLAIERSENRMVLDAISEEPARYFEYTVESLRHAAPKQTAVLRFGSLRQQLLIWTVFEGEIFFESRPIARAALRRQIQSFRDAIQQRQPIEDIRTAGEELGQLLLPDSFDTLPQDTPIVVVPNADLIDLPFAALSRSGSFLPELHPIASSPSLAFLLEAGTDQIDRRKPAKVLSVADPMIDSSHFPYLTQLSSARLGARDLAGLYTDSFSSLIGAEATFDRVVEELADATVLTFSGHSSAATPSGERGLVLAPGEDGRQPLILTSENLPDSSLAHLELALLAACRSGPDTHSGSSEITGLATALLARGAHNVISTAWEVESLGAEAFALEFHRLWQELGRADLALRAAQLAALQSSDYLLNSPATWAAFQLHRGGSGIHSISR